MTYTKLFRIFVGDTVFTEDGSRYTVQGIYYDLDEQPKFTITDGWHTVTVTEDRLSLTRTAFLMSEIAHVTKKIEEISGGDL